MTGSLEILPSKMIQNNAIGDKIRQIRKTEIKDVKKKQNPEKYTGIYSMHKYWSKKPANLMRNLILRYSEQNEIVLDAFCGSGISIVESVQTGRKAVGIDINPASIFITREILDKVDPQRIREEYAKIKNDCENKINDLYKVQRKHKTIIGTHFIWSGNRIKKIWHVEDGKKRVAFNPRLSDHKLAKSFTYEKIPNYYPKAKLFHNAKINARGKMHVYDLFTPRNALALSILLKRIQLIKDIQVRELFKFCFTASLGQSSRMVFVLNGRGTFNGKSRHIRTEVGSWVIGYWIPKENFEINVWKCFSKRFNKIIKAKEEQSRSSYKCVYVNNYKKLKNGNIMLVNDSALSALKKLPNNSIDYAITDPPHVDRLPYLELSMMWNSWLKHKVNYKDELVISKAKLRNKNLHNYNRLLSATILEIQRVLKPNRHFTLIFNSAHKKTWEDLLSILKKSRLQPYNVTKMGYSVNSVVQKNRIGALKTDYVITFKKKKKVDKGKLSLLESLGLVR